MASNNTRFIGKEEIQRKIKAKENNRFKKFKKQFRNDNSNIHTPENIIWEHFVNSHKERRAKQKIENDWSNIFNPYLEIIKEIMSCLRFWYSKMEEALKWISDTMKDCYAIFQLSFQTKND